MKKKKNSSFVVIALLLIVTISIGYAALSTTLNINGTSTIKKQTWSVYFDTLTVTSGSATATTPAAVDTGKTKVSYAVTLNTPGQFYEFTVAVKNAGTLGAKLSAAPTKGGLSTTQAVYTNYTAVWTDTSKAPAAGDTIAAGKSRSVKVRVEYKKDITAAQLPSADTALSLTCSIPYVQA
mgnify:CR=1 FL=1